MNKVLGGVLRSGALLSRGTQLASVQQQRHTARYDPLDTSQVTIPPYEEKHGEPEEVKRARLLYQSRKRGMLENGLLLSNFAARYLPAMREPQLGLYDKLINQPSNDWEIYYWATGVKETPEEFDSEVMSLLQRFVTNEHRENRTRQPDL